MIIAQTGLTTLQTSQGQLTRNSLAASMWWLLPLALTTLISVLILRRIRRLSKVDASLKFPHDTKPSSKTTDSINAIGSAPRKDKASTSKSSKSKKKSRVQSNGSLKVVIQNELKPKKKRSIDPVITAAVLAPPTEPTSKTTLPVQPIFEPLREVGALRLGAIPTKSVSALQITEIDKKSSADTISTRSTGMKFERTANATAAMQTTSNRWPAPVINQNSMKPMLRDARQPSSDTQLLGAMNLTPSPQQTIEAPAQGLKSFVKKVRLTAATADLESGTEVQDYENQLNKATNGL